MGICKNVQDSGKAAVLDIFTLWLAACKLNLIAEFG